MSDLGALDTWLDPVLAALAPGARARLAVRVAADLRRQQISHIKANIDPDGAAYAPRLPQSRARSGAIKRGAMFRKLGTSLTSRGSASEATVTFAGRVARLALVHHAGQVDQVRPGGPLVQYAARPLLGFGAEAIALVRSSILHHLAAAL